jgi:restriction system protein
MDYSPIVSQVFKLWWVAPILVLLVVLKTPWFKGVVGESLVKFAGKLRLPSDKYHAIHNVTLPTDDGTTQIDHIYLSRFGVFVVETKNMKGLIFGTERDAQWTQHIFGKPFKFQNPLRQNYKHVKTLEAALSIPSEAIHSVVVFTGQCTFKSTFPANVTCGMGHVRYIKSFIQPVLSEVQVSAAVERIKSGRLSPSLATARNHIQGLATRHAQGSERSCARCGNQMVLRTAKQGANAGNQFWGCSTYPRCKARQSVA